MLTFIDEDFKKRVIETLKYIGDLNDGYAFIDIEFYDILDDDFDYNDFEDCVIDENSQIIFSLDYSEDARSMRLIDFLDLFDKSKSAKIYDNSICISPTLSYIQIEINHKENYYIMSNLLKSQENIFISNFKYGENICKGSITKKVNLFNIMINLNGDYDKYNPSCNFDFYFELEHDFILSKSDILTIFSSYQFELDSSMDLKISISPRLEIDYSDYDDYKEKTSQFNIPLRNLIFGKGIFDLLNTFNKVSPNYDNDYNIIQLTKTIEFVSRTVIRREITNNIYKKLISHRALNPDANYIKELEEEILNNNKKYDNDRNSIIQTIKECCDIIEFIDHVPEYMKKAKDYKQNLKKQKIQINEYKESILEYLANCIVDTRNSIAHAKANYTKKGDECPEDQKDKFIIMLKIISIQVIRWYFKISETERI